MILGGNRLFVSRRVYCDLGRVGKFFKVVFRFVERGCGFRFELSSIVVGLL